MPSTGFPTDSEVNAWINEHTCEVFDMLVQAGPPDYYAATTSPVNTQIGITSYDLPSDFRSLVGVFVNDSPPRKGRRLRHIPDGNVDAYQAPQGAYSFYLEYLPAPPFIADGGTGDAQAFDGVSGWESLIIKMVARDMLRKRKSDTQELEGDIERLKKRIRTASSNRDLGSPRFLTDSEAEDARYPWWGSTLSGYRLRAGELELFQAVPGWP